MTKYDDHVMEWEAGLPGPEELTPLSQMLITPELAGAFSITPEPCRSLLDVSRASQNTISALRRHNSAPSSTNSMKAFPAFNVGEGHESHELDEHHTGVKSPRGDQVGGSQPAGGDTSDGFLGDKKGRNRESIEEEDSSAFGYENSTDEQSARTLKRPRLVWTPQLHKRFVDVVAHLGIKNAVPKTIMQLMNVEGLTRENVASHLQKYRLYLKRMQGLSNECPSPSDQLFASTPVPHNVAASAFHANHREESMQMPIPMPMHMPFGSPIVPMPGHFHMAGHMNPSAPYGGFDPHAYGTAYGRVFPQRDASADQHNSGADRVESASSYRCVVPHE